MKVMREPRTFFNNVKLSKIRPLWLLVDVTVRYTRCFFLGHKLCWGEHYNYESDYCDKCFVEWPQDRRTIYEYLSAMYGWMVEREWRWFDGLDEWLCTRHRKRLPRWWEY